MAGASLIVMSSLTYAMKGQKALHEKGVQSTVDRLPKGLRVGCGYGLRVHGDPTHACTILRQARITCGQILPI